MREEQKAWAKQGQRLEHSHRQFGLEGLVEIIASLHFVNVDMGGDDKTARSAATKPCTQDFEKKKGRESLSSSIFL